MKVTVNANFRIINHFDPPVTFEFDHRVNLKDLLRALNNIIPTLKLLEGESWGDDLMAVKINEFPLPVFDLNVELRDGDRIYIEIHMEPLGGG